MDATKINLCLRACGDADAAKYAAIGAGGGPAFYLLVNSSRHADPAAFLAAVVAVDWEMFVGRGDADLVEGGGLRVARADIGQDTALGRFGGWDALDAVLLAPSFDHLHLAVVFHAPPWPPAS